jgi:hypothetical protein
MLQEEFARASEDYIRTVVKEHKTLVFFLKPHKVSDFPLGLEANDVRTAAAAMQPNIATQNAWGI